MQRRRGMALFDVPRTIQLVSATRSLGSMPRMQKLGSQWVHTRARVAKNLNFFKNKIIGFKKFKSIYFKFKNNIQTFPNAHLVWLVRITINTVVIPIKWNIIKMHDLFDFLQWFKSWLKSNDKKVPDVRSIERDNCRSEINIINIMWRCSIVEETVEDV